jgi:hypothetical protein
MNNHEFVLLLFDRDDLECDSLEIIAEEYNSLVDVGVRRASEARDQLKTTPLDNMD